MKEFTLNADFGMTASDNSFNLYGIHTGDTIMFKKVKDFPADGSLVAVIIDNGPIALKRISYAHELELLYLEGGSSREETIFIGPADLPRLKVLGMAVSVIHSLAPAEE